MWSYVERGPIGQDDLNLVGWFTFDPSADETISGAIADIRDDGTRVAVDFECVRRFVHRHAELCSNLLGIKTERLGVVQVCLSVGITFGARGRSRGNCSRDKAQRDNYR